MRAASAALKTLLASQQFLMADLLTITTANGSAYRYTSADIDITSGGNLFTSKDILFSRDKTSTVTGVQVAQLGITLYASPSNLIGGIPALQALHNGGMDGATVRLERAFMPTWGDTSAGTILLFTGSLSESEFGRTEAKLTAKSALELLNIQMPRNLFTPNCIHTLFDSGCGLIKATYNVATSVNNTSTTRVLNTGLAQAAGYFDQGTLTFTSGANNGVTRNVQSYGSGQFVLSYPLSAAPAIGDTFNVAPGCDKTQATCNSKFNNLPQLKACPYIPTPETAL